MAAKPVAIIMGSQSDWTTLRHAADTLDALGVAYDAKIVSAHRTPERLYAFAKSAKAAKHVLNAVEAQKLLTAFWGLTKRDVDGVNSAQPALFSAAQR